MDVIIPTVSKKKNASTPNGLTRFFYLLFGSPKSKQKNLLPSFSDSRKRTKKTARPGPIKSSPKWGVLQLAALKQIKRLFHFGRFL
ncbi:MAG: hypothetical protein J6J74_05825 [Elusimicrobiaceae bacterium]|nr:hypothetical protein [Elusimicrobiaceae bacterium]